LNEQGDEIDRVPRTTAEESLLLRSRPPGWEYLFYGAVLLRGKNELEPRWQEHESRTRRPAERALTEAETPAYLARAIDKMGHIVGDLDRRMSPRSQRRAFGKPGKVANQARIAALAEDIVGCYRAFLEVSAQLRAEGIPPKYRHLADICSEMADAPLGQFRDFIDGSVKKLDGVPRAVRQKRPVNLELIFNIANDEEVMARHREEIDRLQGDQRTTRRPIPASVRNEVWRRDQGRCVDCGSRERLEYDHIIPVSRGGSNTARNIELRCETCNRTKGARI
jgi:5-methylcytosine-specific restriction endonuclease McrA